MLPNPERHLDAEAGKHMQENHSALTSRNPDRAGKLHYFHPFIQQEISTRRHSSDSLSLLGHGLIIEPRRKAEPAKPSQPLVCMERTSSALL